MISFIRISKIYASSLFTVSGNLKKKERIYTSLEMLEKNIILNKTKNINIFNKNCPQSRLHSICSKIPQIKKCDVLIKNFIKVLIKNKRLFLLKEIIKEYKSCYRQHLNQHTIQIIISHKNETIIKKIKTTLNTYLKKQELFYNILIDPKIIAGFKIKFKGFILDYSITQNILKIGHKLLHYI